jgi:hypothetical protein
VAVVLAEKLLPVVVVTARPIPVLVVEELGI